MKKLLALLLVLTMLFSVATLLSGCDDDGGKKASSSKKDDDDDEEEDTKEDDPMESQDPTDPSEPTEPQGPTEYVFDDTDGGPLLYKVTDSDGDVIWLFGTIHVGRDDFYPLPEYVQEAYEQSDALAVEADIVAFEGDMAAQTQMVMKMLYRDGTTISSHISPELYSVAKNILSENGQYSYALDYYNIAMWYQSVSGVVAQKAGGDVSLGIDRYFLNDAKSSGKTIVEVESVMFQYEMLADFSEELQIFLLQQTVASYTFVDESKKELNDMMDLWQSGNEADWAEYCAQQLEISEDAPYENYVALMEEYNQAMILDRNEGMTQYAVEALETGDELFICVGSAHVFGEDGMADNLRELGYKVELIRS